MLRTNKEKVIKQSVQGKIHHPTGRGYKISNDGVPRVIPGVGGITYNVKVGDSAFGWAGDHIEPGVSIKNENNQAEGDALTIISCIGNEAKVISGDAKGAVGYVTGGHGGIDHVLIDFNKEDMEKMVIGDSILIKGYGQGLELLDYPDIKVMNIDPNLFEKLGMREENGEIIVPVAAKVPAHLMGSGIGSGSAYTGDYDIMTADNETIKKLGLDKLRLGDLVLLEDCDNCFGVGYFKGSVSIGIVVHADCILSGHGPGVTVIMSTRKGNLIKGEIVEKANISDYINK